MHRETTTLWAQPPADYGRSGPALDRAAASSRAGRADTLQAIHALEDALAAPAPRRERTWQHRVAAALDLLIAALAAQASGDDETASLLSQIERDDPRLRAHVDQLRAEQADLRIAATALLDRVAPASATTADVGEVRERLSTLARRLRAHRAREADLVYEAVNIDLGVAG